VILEKAKADAQYSLLTNMSKAYKTLMQAGGIVEDVDKIHFIFSSELRSIKADNIYVGTNATVVNIKS